MAQRDVCPCVWCEFDFKKNGERYVGRWTDEQRQLTKDYFNPKLDRQSPHVPFAQAMVFGSRHASQFGTWGSAPVRLMPRRLIRKRDGKKCGS